MFVNVRQPTWYKRVANFSRTARFQKYYEAWQHRSLTKRSVERSMLVIGQWPPICSAPVISPVTKTPVRYVSNIRSMVFCLLAGPWWVFRKNFFLLESFFTCFIVYSDAKRNILNSFCIFLKNFQQDYFIYIS